MSIKAGIVGLPNVGKSTLFNALTSSCLAQAANFPFCTIEPNVGRVNVPDERLLKLAELAGSQKIIPTSLEFVDIAGLVKGASKGEGLGNKFLSHIREVDAICHLIRCFENDDITNTQDSVDPIRDKEIIDTELMLADLESLLKQASNLEKKSRGQDKDAAAYLEVAKKIIVGLEQGKNARDTELTDDEKIIAKTFNLLTIKPVLYVCNVDENSAVNGNEFSNRIVEIAKHEGNETVIISAEIEKEIALLESVEDQRGFLSSIGLTETGLDKVIKASYKLLSLITYFTIGPKEAHAWTVKEGSKAPQAAGEIHTDFEKGFIRAETISYEDYIAYKNEANVRAAGKLRIEGKDYIVQDGDIMHFLFNN